METLIELLLKAIPLAKYLEKLGISKEASVALSFLLIAAFLYALYKLVKWGVHRRKNLKAAKNLDPHFDYLMVKKARDIFIPTQWQNISPTRKEEPQYSSYVDNKSPLIPHLLKKGFDEKDGSDRFFLVLAGSGMGKTTFMLNLYIAYHSFFNRLNAKYNMCLFPFGDKRTLDRIREIEPKEAKNTILLLDAFDEDPFLLAVNDEHNLPDDERFRRRLDEVMDAVQDFKRVVITCRTQYFPERGNQDYELNIKRYDGKGFHKLPKLYISPFDDDEIQRYLNKKYGRLKFWNRSKKRKAQYIVSKAGKLMVRPMLLSNIDFLVEGNEKDYERDSYEIYEMLVHGWLEREADKRKKEAEKEKFKQSLDNYSQMLALEMYAQRGKLENMKLLSQEAAMKLAQEQSFDLKGYEITGQSLLTRDVEGNLKFAHKSIMEYYIAKTAIENLQFARTLDYATLDMARKFYLQKKLPDTMVFVEGGTFQMGGNIGSYDKPIHKVSVKDFYIGKYPVTQAQWKKVMGDNKNRSYFKGDDLPVEGVSWRNAQAFIAKLNEMTGLNYRLPTEAEWEYAARGGGKSKNYEYSGSNDLAKVGWYVKNSGRKTQPVGSLAPNELGLYDMSGNVWEWCEDDWHDNYENAPDDGSAWVNEPRGSSRVLRGGSWSGNSEHCRVAIRHYIHSELP